MCSVRISAHLISVPVLRCYTPYSYFVVPLHITIQSPLGGMDVERTYRKPLPSFLLAVVGAQPREASRQQLPRCGGHQGPRLLQGCQLGQRPQQEGARALRAHRQGTPNFPAVMVFATLQQQLHEKGSPRKDGHIKRLSLPEKR
jgi:hypothetical protein